MLVEKGIPLLGSAGGAIAGGFAAGPAGIAPGMSLGTGLGTTLSGLISDKPTSEAKMAKGMQGAMKGWGDWQQLPPEKKLDISQAGKIPGASSPTATTPATIGQLASGGMSQPSAPSSGYVSSYAPNFAKDIYHRKPEDMY